MLSKHWTKENTEQRVASILHDTALDTEVTGLKTFSLSSLDVPGTINAVLPQNLRLGLLAERIVAQLIKASSNYNVLHENLQITDGNNTIGELDFIIQHTTSAQVTHLELAYKFYLYDPSISVEPINNWIGPNRNDSLIEKLHKVRTKQFPLLQHERTRALLPEFENIEISQALCLLASLYLPYAYQGEVPAAYSHAIKGYYIDYKQFTALHTAEKLYFLPPKKAWGMDPSQHGAWEDFSETEPMISSSLADKRCLLCWQKRGGLYSEFFITWWY